MLSRLIIPLVYLFIATSSLVQSHEFPLHHRRLLKARSTIAQDLGPIVQNVGDLPAASSDSQIPASQSVQSTSSLASASTTSASASTSALISISIPVPILTNTASSTASSSSQSLSSTTSSSTSSSTSTSLSSTPTSTPQTPASINANPLPVTDTANVVASTITSTQSLSATPSNTTVPQVQSASSKTKSTTVTALIAVAASVGGIAILWTIFRKWKLSSSKEFDRRLNPITDWQPIEDHVTPTLGRAPSTSSSFHSGGGSANGHSSSRSAGFGNEHSLAPPEHDFVAGPSNSAPIGGYADLARASSPNPPMQQVLGGGPSFNRGYDDAVPLHHQTGYGAYDYNASGGGPRY